MIVPWRVIIPNGTSSIPLKPKTSDLTFRTRPSQTSLRLCAQGMVFTKPFTSNFKLTVTAPIAIANCNLANPNQNWLKTKKTGGINLSFTNPQTNQNSHRMGLPQAKVVMCHVADLTFFRWQKRWMNPAMIHSKGLKGRASC